MSIIIEKVKHTSIYKSVVGEEKFKELTQNVASRCFDRLCKSKEQLLRDGVPERYIVYIIKNHGDRLGAVFIKYEHACEIINKIHKVSVLHDYGTVEEGHECFCMDGCDYDGIRFILCDFKIKREEWLAKLENKEEWFENNEKKKDVASEFAKLKVV